MASALSDDSSTPPAVHQSVFTPALVHEWTAAASSTTGVPLAELAVRLNQSRVANLCSQPPEIQHAAAELCSKLADKWRQDTACCASRLSIILFFRHVALSDPTWFVKSVKPIDWIPMFCDALLVFHSPCCVVDVATTDCTCKLMRIGALESLKALIDHHLPDQVSQFCAQQFVPKLLSRLQRATCVPITVSDHCDKLHCWLSLVRLSRSMLTPKLALQLVMMVAQSCFHDDHCPPEVVHLLALDAWSVFIHLWSTSPLLSQASNPRWNAIQMQMKPVLHCFQYAVESEKCSRGTALLARVLYSVSLMHHAYVNADTNCPTDFSSASVVAQSIVDQILIPILSLLITQNNANGSVIKALFDLIDKVVTGQVEIEPVQCVFNWVDVQPLNDVIRFEFPEDLKLQLSQLWTQQPVVLEWKQQHHQNAPSQAASTEYSQESVILLESVPIVSKIGTEGSQESRPPASFLSYDLMAPAPSSVMSPSPLKSSDLRFNSSEPLQSPTKRRKIVTEETELHSLSAPVVQVESAESEVNVSLPVVEGNLALLLSENAAQQRLLGEIPLASPDTRRRLLELARSIQQACDHHAISESEM